MISLHTECWNMRCHSTELIDLSFNRYTCLPGFSQAAWPQIILDFDHWVRMIYNSLWYSWQQLSMLERYMSLMGAMSRRICIVLHDDVIKWKHFPRYRPFVRGIHRSPVNSPQKGQWHGALMLPSICAWINGWVNNREAGDLRRHRAHHDITVMHTTGH